MHNSIRGEIYKRFRKMSEFAAAIGWSRTTVSRVINGDRKLTEQEASVWKAMLGCHLNDLAPALEFNPGKQAIQRKLFPSDDMLTAEELAAALRQTPADVRALADKRRLPHYRFGDILLFDPAEVIKCARVEVAG